MSLVKLTKIGRAAFLDNSIDSVNILDNSVTESKFANLSVVDTKIQDLSIVNSKFVPNLDVNIFVDNSITINKLNSVLDFRSANIDVTFPNGIGGVTWNESTIYTTDFTAVSGKGYFVDTSSSSITINLPTADIGSFISVVNTTESSNSIIFNPGLNKLNGNYSSLSNSSARSGVLVVFSGNSNGWVVVDSVNETTDKILLNTSPIISSVSPTFFQADGNTITLTGSFFRDTAQITLTGLDSTTYAQNTTTVSADGTTLTFLIPTGMLASLSSNANDPFDITVTHSDDGLSHTLQNSLEYTSAPTFTNSASLGTIPYDGNHTDLTTQPNAVVLDSDEIITYSLTSGSLPSGMSLNSSTGEITGTPSYGSLGDSPAVYNFSITASITSDVSNISSTSTENYSITVESNQLIINSVSPTDYDGNSGTEITLSGSGFRDPVKSIANIYLISSGGTSYTASYGSYTGLYTNTAMIIVTPQDFLVDDAPLDIRIVLNDGTQTTAVDAITTGSAPTMLTPAGVIAEITPAQKGNGNFPTNISVAGSDPDSSVSYVLSTSFSGGNLGFDSVNGIVSGYVLESEFSNASFHEITFGVKAIDNAGNLSPERIYTILLTTGLEGADDIWEPGDGYLYHTISDSSTSLTVLTDTTVDYIMLAAGGGSSIGGGGAGGFILNTNTTITAGTYSFTIGANGTGSGGNTVAFGQTVYGGGALGSSGGSGGGRGGKGCYPGSTYINTPTIQGYDGGLQTSGTTQYSTPGGGGATAAGTNEYAGNRGFHPGEGGKGIQFPPTNGTYYAGGGGGKGYNTSNYLWFGYIGYPGAGFQNYGGGNSYAFNGPYSSTVGKPGAVIVRHQKASTITSTGQTISPDNYMQWRAFNSLVFTSGIGSPNADGVYYIGAYYGGNTYYQLSGYYDVPQISNVYTKLSVDVYVGLSFESNTVHFGQYYRMMFIDENSNNYSVLVYGGSNMGYSSYTANGFITQPRLVGTVFKDDSTGYWIVSPSSRLKWDAYNQKCYLNGNEITGASGMTLTRFDLYTGYSTNLPLVTWYNSLLSDNPL
jgi:hypothetical protein